MKRKIPLKHYRKYPPELKVKVCKDREKGLSLRECAKKYKLFRPGSKEPPDSLILGWEKLFKELGPNCFFVNRQGNRSQYGSDGEPTSLKAKKKIKELREENEKLRLQVDYLKKIERLGSRKPKKREIFQVVHGLRYKYKLSELLEASGLSKSLYFYHLKKMDEPNKNEKLEEEIVNIFKENKGRYGYRRIKFALLMNMVWSLIISLFAK